MSKRRNERGAAVVEFALLLPLLVILVLGVIDFGRAASLRINLNEVVQEGAIYGATNPEFANHADIKTRMIQSSDQPPLNPSDITITCPTPRTLRVAVSYTVDFITPLLPGTLTLDADVVTDVLVESADCTDS